IPITATAARPPSSLSPAGTRARREPGPLHLPSPLTTESAGHHRRGADHPFHTTQRGVVVRKEEAMEDDTPSPGRPSRRWGRPAGLVAASLIAGSILAGTLSARAQSSSSNSANSSSATAGARDESQAGPGETLLTGT